jgi:hypothetical protein
VIAAARTYPPLLVEEVLRLRGGATDASYYPALGWMARSWLRVVRASIVLEGLAVGVVEFGDGGGDSLRCLWWFYGALVLSNTRQSNN